MDYKERYDKVIASGAYPKRSDKIKALAQLNFNNCPSNGREQAVCDALEDYEMMTGNWHDPSKDEYQEWQDSIVNPLRKEIDKCQRSITTFSTEELCTGSCKWESACYYESGCPLTSFSEEIIDAELKERGVAQEDYK